tara:strand:+ start:181 stop:597 length:417 start_codon:yes stop_codon:yes gene_type:complete
MNLFDWLKEINYKKSPVDSFTDKNWDEFNAYMVHRFLSMDSSLLELVNEVQSLPPTDKKQIYSIYKEYIPKNNKWNKYIKSTVKQPNKDLIQYLKNYFKLSSREILDYINILSKNQIISILSQLGIEDKEIKKLLKRG